MMSVRPGRQGVRFSMPFLNGAYIGSQRLWAADYNCHKRYAQIWLGRLVALLPSAEWTGRPPPVNAPIAAYGQSNFGASRLA